MVRPLPLLCLAMLAGCTWSLPTIPCSDDTQCLQGQTCQRGACGPRPSCSGGQQACGAACVDVSQDRGNCGTCGHACSGAEACQGGGCVPPAGGTHALAVVMAGAGSGKVTSSPSGINCPTGACLGNFTSGSTVTLTALAANGSSTFSGWGGACTGAGLCSVALGADKSVTATFAGVAATKTLSVTVNGAGSGTVTSSPPGLTCASGNCSASFPAGTVVTLAQSPGAGSNFSGWGGACGGFAGCSLALNADSAVTATFTLLTQPQKGLSVTLAGTGSGTVTSSPSGINCSSGTCSGQFDTGASVTLTATSTGGSTFSGFGGDCTGSACALAMSADRAVTATFAAAVVTRLLTVIVAGAGTVTSNPPGITCASGTCTASFEQGTSVTLTAAPDASATFAGFAGCVASGNSCTLAMTADHGVTASFPHLYKLNVDVAGCGNVSSSPAGIDCNGTACSAQFQSGAVVTLTAVANCGGQAFLGFSGDCTGTGACKPVMTQNRAVVASFGGFTVTSASANRNFSMVPGESRVLDVTVSRVSGGAAIAAALTLSALPGGVTTSFSPATVDATGHSTLTLTAAADAPLGSTQLTITGTAAPVVATSAFVLEVRARYAMQSPYGLAVESTDTTALVSESGRVVRVDLATKAVLRTIVDLQGVMGLAVESSGATALAVVQDGTLRRIDLATGTVTTLSSSLLSPRSLAIEAGGASALVTDCGPTSCYGAARLVRVTLSSGVVTTISAGLNDPHAVALEPGGLKALVAESGANVLTEVNLASGSTIAIASGIVSPAGVLLEPGGTSALVTDSGGRILRVVLATGTQTAISLVQGGGNNGSALGELGLRADGHTLVVLRELWDGTAGFAVSLDTRWPVATVAPSRQSGTRLGLASGIALEGAGTTALVTDCGAAGNCAGSAGRLLRVTLASGIISEIVSTGFQVPRAVAIFQNGARALVAENVASGRLADVDLNTKGFTSKFSIPYPWGLAIESGTTALVASHTGPILRVNLDGTGAPSQVGLVPGNPDYPYVHDLAIEAGGATALAANSSYNSGVFRVTLGNSTTRLSFGLGEPWGMAIEAGGGSALVTEGNFSRFSRVDLATGSSTVLATMNRDYFNQIAPPGSIALEAGGGTALVVDGDRIARVTLGAVYTPQTIARGLTGPDQGSAPVAIEPGGASVLFADCSGTLPFCGRLLRVGLAGGTPSVLATGFNTIQGIAPQDAGFALITECGAAANTCVSGQVLRVNLANGSSSQVSGGLNTPVGIALESGGATALLAEGGTDRVLRVTLADGSLVALGTSLRYLNQVVPEAGGATALVAGEGALKRLDLTTHVAKVIAYWNVRSIAIEPGGATALVLGSGTGLPASLARVDLATGGVDLLRAGLFDKADGFALDATGKTAIFAESKSNGRGGIYKLGL